MPKELPPICEQGTHDFRSCTDTVTPTCGAFEGADVYSEVMVLPGTPTKTPKKDDVCNNCFQRYGREEGTRDPHLSRTYLDLASWETD